MAWVGWFIFFKTNMILCLWFSEAHIHRQQLKMIANIGIQLMSGVTSDTKRATISLSLFISLSHVLTIFPTFH